MTSKCAFVQKWKRLQTLSLAFVAMNLAAFIFHQAALPWLWGVFLPFHMFLAARLRCWKCNERLSKDAWAHLEWSPGSGIFGARHATGSAEPI